MNTLKTFLFSKFETIGLLIISISFSIFLLMLRMKLTHSFFFIFLVWNLFLAVIPFCITEYLQIKQEINKFVFAIWFVTWLLFLPNSPYIITDFLHLKLSDTNIIWLDILVVFSFAFNGLLLYYFSVKQMFVLLIKRINKRLLQTIQIGIFILSGFGVYLGRFLRYNSWEIVQNPYELLNDIFQIILHPNQNIQAWLFTFGFSVFLGVGFWVFENLKYTKNVIS